MSKDLDFDDVLSFGIYKGNSVRSLTLENPSYIIFLQCKTIHKFTKDVLKEVYGNYTLLEKWKYDARCRKINKQINDMDSTFQIKF